MTEKISARNLSPVSWYIASTLHRFQELKNKRLNSNSRCLAWENTVLIKVADPEEAFRA